MPKKKFQWEADSGLPRDAPPAPRDRGVRKREADAVDQLVDDLLAVPAYERKNLPLDEDVLEGLITLQDLADRSVRGGMRRQRLYVAGRLRLADTDAVRAAMPQHGGISPREQVLQLAEHWRKRLLRDGDTALDELLVEFPDADRQILRQRIRQAAKEQAAAKPGKAFKALFADLRALLGL